MLCWNTQFTRVSEGIHALSIGKEGFEARTMRILLDTGRRALGGRRSLVVGDRVRGGRRVEL